MSRAGWIAVAIAVIAVSIYLWVGPLAPPKPKLIMAEPDDNALTVDTNGARISFASGANTMFTISAPGDQRFQITRGWPSDAGLIVQCDDLSEVGLYRDDAGYQRIYCR